MMVGLNAVSRLQVLAHGENHIVEKNSLDPHKNDKISEINMSELNIFDFFSFNSIIKLLVLHVICMGTFETKFDMAEAHNVSKTW